MSVLVTGGAGYIGSHTVRLLQERGRDVVVLDNLEFGNPAAVSGVPLIEGDIADTETVTEVVRRFDVNAVVHFAAYKFAGESMGQPGRYFLNNVSKSTMLIETMHRLGVNNLVFSSSSAVYGTPSEIPVSEVAPIQPESPYGESKAMIERVLAWYDRCCGLRSVSLRYFNAAGAWPDGTIGENWNFTFNLVPLIMKVALGQLDELQLFGDDYPTPDGTAIRDYVHVVDLAEAHIKALEHLESGGSSTAINIGTGIGSSVLQVICAAENVASRSIPYVVHGRRSGDPIALFADSTRSRELLTWTPRYGLADIVSSAWEWHSKHLDGYA